MSSRVTIVMYHFVRDLERSRYPRIKGLRLGDFRGQLEYVSRHYRLIRMEDLLAAVYEKAALPPQAALLTFDDGYRDHFDHVFPILDDMNVQGSFFPPARAVLENHVLDVNKIHFVLASLEDPSPVSDFILRAIDERRSEFDLRESRYYFEMFSEAHRFDSPEVTFIKRVLQRGLPDPIRSDILDELFKRYVSSDEAAFARELYVDSDQLKCMLRHGMFVGSHGYSHRWLNYLEGRAMEDEVDLSLEFLESVGATRDRWVMCYPYGGYNEAVLALLRKKSCGAGLTADVGISDISVDDPLLLPRLDTNDLPRSMDSELAEWTKTTRDGM
jgi:peptidoglycan/xylan/chitin deacetylase (PgdA/CDA1 family)